MSGAFDYERFGSKVPHYWDVFVKIMEALKQAEDADDEPAINKDELDKLLKSILVHLKDATNSNIAFVTDSEGKILSTEPGDKQLKVNRLPLSKAQLKRLKGLESLVNKGEPFIAKTQVVSGFEGTQKETQEYLRRLGVDSLFLVRLETQHGIRYIGMADGKPQQSHPQGEDDPPYLGEDKQFIYQLMSMLAATVEKGTQIQGIIENERINRSDRYCRARILGEWGYLARASEDYASVWKQVNEIPYDEVRPCKGWFDTISFDDVVADYLDAELCLLIYDPNELQRKRKKSDVAEIASDGQDIVESSKAQNFQESASTVLLKLCKSIMNKVADPDEYEYETFDIRLRDNKKWLYDDRKPEQIIFLKHGRSSLALARICLWAAYMDCQVDSEQSLQDDSNQDVIEPTQVATARKLRPLREFQWEELFWEFPDWLIESASIGIQKSPKNITDPEFELFTDLARTVWQKIYYLSRDEIKGTIRSRIDNINKLYKKVWNQTAQILHIYLMSGEHNVEVNSAEMHIDSDWLFAWLISNVLLSDKLNKYYNLTLISSSSREDAALVSPTTKLRYIMNLSQCVLYILHCARHRFREYKLEEYDSSKKELNRFRRPPFADIPLIFPSSRSHALLFIISEYAYREIGLHRELNIFENLIRQLRFELPLYAAHDFYRDHLYHVIDVCLLGELILRSSYMTKGMLADILADAITSGERQEVFRNWYLAALFHDIGYVVEQADRFLDPIKHITGNGLTKFGETATQGLHSGKKEILQEIDRCIEDDEFSFLLPDSLLEYLKDTNPTDHGIVAWLFLKNIIENIKYPIESFKPALTAILRHNLSNQEDVDVNKEPLTLLLMLCDHLQEWGRPRIGPDPLARSIMEALRFSEQPDLRQKVRMKELHIQPLKMMELDKVCTKKLRKICGGCLHNLSTFNTNKTKCHRAITKISKPEFIFNLPHTDSREGDFEPTISWLLFCRDLQCLVYGKKHFWLNITVTLNHAPPRMWQFLPWQPLELDILEEYATTDAPAAYLCEWINSARNNKQGINYTADELGNERFEIKLHELERPLPRGLSDELWQNFYEWKWRWLGQKFINLNYGAAFPEVW